MDTQSSRAQQGSAHLLLVRVGTVSQGSAAGGSLRDGPVRPLVARPEAADARTQNFAVSAAWDLDRIGNEAARSVALDDIHVQRGDARLSAGLQLDASSQGPGPEGLGRKRHLHQHGLLCRTGRGSPSAPKSCHPSPSRHEWSLDQGIPALLPLFWVAPPTMVPTDRSSFSWHGASIKDPTIPTGSRTGDRVFRWGPPDRPSSLDIEAPRCQRLPTCTATESVVLMVQACLPVILVGWHRK